MYNYKKAITLFLLFISICFTLNASAYDSVAIAKYNEGIDLCANSKYKEAVSAFNYSIEADPTFIDAYFNLGSVYEYLKDYNNAILTFQSVLAKNPKDSEAALKIANIYFKKSNYSQALSYLKNIQPEDKFYNDSQVLSKKITAAVNAQKQKAIAKAQASSQAAVNIYKGFDGPTGIAKDASGNLYVAGFSDNTITKISPAGARKIIAKNSPINGPLGIAVDDLYNVYVANYNSGQIVKISKTGEITILVKNIPKPYYLLYNKNCLFVTEQQTNTVRRINL